MGTITRDFANNITTSGILLPASLNNNSIANVTAYNASIATGNMVLLSSQTASASASINFTTNINSTYKEYQFVFFNIRPATENASFGFQGSTDGGSNYALTITSSAFRAIMREDGADSGLGYVTAEDLSQSTSLQRIADEVNGDADQGVSGLIQIFNPASTTYVKHFASNTNFAHLGVQPYTENHYVAGYMNTTSAVNAIQFKFTSGNITAGTILMYGIV
jgi:hypothetical protein